jgi:hypothetical protein
MMNPTEDKTKTPNKSSSILKVNNS